MNSTKFVGLWHVDFPEEWSPLGKMVCDITVSYRAVEGPPSFSLLGRYRSRMILPTNTISIFSVSLLLLPFPLPLERTTWRKQPPGPRSS